MSRPTVVVLVPSPVLRAGLVAALEAGGCDVVGQAARPDDLPPAGHVPAAVCVLDVAQPERCAPELTSLRRILPTSNVVVLVDHHDDAVLLQSLRAGATGYLVGDLPPDHLCHAVQALAAGEVVVPRRYVRLLVEAACGEAPAGLLVPRPRRPDDAPSFTRREQQVLDLLRAGRSTARIAAELYVSQGTVRTHVAAILRKAHVRDRQGLLGPAGR